MSVINNQLLITFEVVFVVIVLETLKRQGVININLHLINKTAASSTLHIKNFFSHSQLMFIKYYYTVNVKLILAFATFNVKSLNISSNKRLLCSERLNNNNIFQAHHFLYQHILLRIAYYSSLYLVTVNRNMSIGSFALIPALLSAIAI